LELGEKNIDLLGGSYEGGRGNAEKTAPERKSEEKELLVHYSVLKNRRRGGERGEDQATILEEKARR